MATKINSEFIDFLVEAKKNGYASGNSKTRENDGSKSITFHKGQYRYHDNYFGGEPYGGRTVVSIDNKPFWMMVYYGRVIEGNIKDIYSFLRKALRTIPREAPYRGDTVFEEEDFRYINIIHQNFIHNFFGEEQIFQGRKMVYRAMYQGGLINQ